VGNSPRGGAQHGGGRRPRGRQHGDSAARQALLPELRPDRRPQASRGVHLGLAGGLAFEGGDSSPATSPTPISATMFTACAPPRATISARRRRTSRSARRRCWRAW
jgi:hypothetical protein